MLGCASGIPDRLQGFKRLEPLPEMLALGAHVRQPDAPGDQGAKEGLAVAREQLSQPRRGSHFRMVVDVLRSRKRLPNSFNLGQELGPGKALSYLFRVDEEEGLKFVQRQVGAESGVGHIGAPRSEECRVGK